LLTAKINRKMLPPPPTPSQILSVEKITYYADVSAETQGIELGNNLSGYISKFLPL
jgi:hypothetical protein